MQFYQKEVLWADSSDTSAVGTLVISECQGQTHQKEAQPAASSKGNTVGRFIRRKRCAASS